MKRIFQTLMLVLAGGLLLAVGGCATTDQAESDLPWNTPQMWEGSPTIPGLNDQY